MTKKCIFWFWKENQRNKIEVPDPNRGMIQSAMKYSLKRKTRYSLLLAPSVVFYVVRGPPRGGGGGGNEIPMCNIPDFVVLKYHNTKLQSVYLYSKVPWVPEVFLACGGNFRCWPKADTS